MIAAIRWDRNPITRAGVYAGVHIDDYHRHDVTIRPSVSSSGLRRIWNVDGTGSPAHFYAYWTGNPNHREGNSDLEWQVFGRATHWLLTGEAGFADQFVIRPDEITVEKIKDGKTAPVTYKWNANRNECRAWLRDHKAAGKTVITEEQFATIKDMAIALGHHPLYRAGAMEGDIERSLIWIDPETGVFCKARPDVIPTDSGDVCDLKTCQSVSYPALQRSLADHGYYRQAAWIADGLKIAAGIEMASFSLIFIEKRFPHCVRVVTLDPQDIARGAEENLIALRAFARCLDSGRWPGPGADHSDGEVLRLSDLQRERIDARLRFELPERHAA